jgi:uncharacterized membrane protein YesL
MTTADVDLKILYSNIVYLLKYFFRRKKSVIIAYSSVLCIVSIITIHRKYSLQIVVSFNEIRSKKAIKVSICGHYSHFSALGYARHDGG